MVALRSPVQSTVRARHEVGAAFGRVIERRLLRGGVVCDGKRHQLVEVHRISTVVAIRRGETFASLKTPLHYQGRDAEVDGNVLNGPAFLDQSGKGFKLVRRVYGLALQVLGQAGGAGRGIGTGRQGTSYSLSIRRVYASSFNAAKRRTPATAS